MVSRGQAIGSSADETYFSAGMSIVERFQHRVTSRFFPACLYRRRQNTRQKASNAFDEHFLELHRSFRIPPVD